MAVRRQNLANETAKVRIAEKISEFVVGLCLESEANNDLGRYRAIALYADCIKEHTMLEEVGRCEDF